MTATPLAQKKKLLTLVEKMPAFPRSVNTVLKLASDINCPTKTLVDVVASDPVLTLRVLRLVNSSYFGLAQAVTSVHHALVTLGANTLKNLVLSLALMGALPRDNRAGLGIDAFWRHCLAVGVAARTLAKATGQGRSEAEDYFVAGLLHDAGKLVLAQYMAEEFAQAMELARARNVDLCAAEQAAMGMDHAQAGGLLARHWGLPDQLAASLEQHHHPSDENPSPMADAVFAANQAVKAMGLGFSGNPFVAPTPAGVAGRMGMGEAEVLAALAGLAEELDSAGAFLEA